MFKSFKKSKISSLIIVVSTFLLAFGTPSVSLAQSVSSEQSVKNAETYVNDLDTSEVDELFDILEQTIYKDGDNYQFDSEKALELGLTETQVNDLNKLYDEYFTDQDMAELYNELQNRKQSNTPGQITTMSATSNIALLWNALIVFAGYEIATNVVADAYKLGVISACEKWKSKAVVKKPCKALGYLK
ncbi:hypothetical protein [Priestia aryabhattai]|uniref:hypothetical protein n=1 Tax=Priestia aryabhattai TaxID=412384 RepID=UPI0032E89504